MTANAAGAAGSSCGGVYNASGSSAAIAVRNSCIGYCVGTVQGIAAWASASEAVYAVVARSGRVRVADHHSSSCD